MTGEEDELTKLVQNLGTTATNCGMEVNAEKKILCFFWFPLSRGKAGLLVTSNYGYFCNLFPLVPVVGLFSPLFFLPCLSEISLHTVISS